METVPLSLMDAMKMAASRGSVTGRLGGGAVDSTADGISREKGYM